ncbi:MAG: sulfotransferase [Gemmatimonadota bacterium]
MLGNADPKAPNFFILGAAKSGTTTLYRLLSEHPQIFLTRQKETYFFSDEQYFSKGLAAYLRNHFNGAGGYPVRGEATANYFHSPDLVAPRLLAAFGPGLRFAVMLRDPVKRAWSHYLHMVRLSAENRPFEEAVRDIGGNISRGWRDYFSDGLYARQLARWYGIFPRENFIFFLTTDLAEDWERVARKAFSFLGVDPDVRIPQRLTRNVAGEVRYRWLARLLNDAPKWARRLRVAVPYHLRQQIRDVINLWNKRPLTENLIIDQETERFLREQYAPDVVRLQDLIGRNLESWLPGSKSARRESG